jgi:hypothetical protein
MSMKNMEMLIPDCIAKVWEAATGREMLVGFAN